MAAAPAQRPSAVAVKGMHAMPGEGAAQVPPGHTHPLQRPRPELRPASQVMQPCAQVRWTGERPLESEQVVSRQKVRIPQMGYGRAGWYSWDHLDNWGQASADDASIPSGNRSPSGTTCRRCQTTKAWWEVAALEPERFLGLRASVDLRMRPFDPRGPRPQFYSDSLWAFLLEELPVAARGSWRAATGPSGRGGFSPS